MTGIEHQGHHDWLSAEYVDRWVQDWSAREWRRPQLCRVASCLPLRPGSRAKVMDLGSGWGPVAEVLLSGWPLVTVTLVDISAPMLEHARRRLEPYGARAVYEVRDFSQEGWEEGLGGPFDAVVSGLAVHNLRLPERIGRVYSAVARSLVRGGCFVNLDRTGPSGPVTGQALQRLCATGQGADGQEGSGLAAPRSSSEPPLSLAEHMSLLKSAGFAEVDCLWREEQMALFFAVRS